MANWLKRISRAIEREYERRIRRASGLDRQQRQMPLDEGAEIANIPRGAAASRPIRVPEPRLPSPAVAAQPPGQRAAEPVRPEAGHDDEEEEGAMSNIPPGKPMG